MNKPVKQYTMTGKCNIEILNWENYNKELNMAKTEFKKLPKFKTVQELFTAAKTCDRCKLLIINTLENLGCEHLARRKTSKGVDTVKWEAYSDGLYQYIGSLVGEYGIDESQAFKDVLEEINSLRTHINEVTGTLEWK